MTVKRQNVETSKRQNEERLAEILRDSKVRVVFGAGVLSKLGAIAADEGATRVLLVTDPGIVRAGHVGRAVQSLRDAGIETTVFDGVRENPTTDHVAAGVHVARELGVNFLIGLGGGSSMDCAKGINFILTNGGRMQDYWGVGKATRPMLPLIAIPTTAGTGSEAQSFALITDPATHQKMACGDEKTLPHVAILDPDLTATMPRDVAAATGIDPVAHPVETAGTLRRNAISRELSREAWRRLDAVFEVAIAAAKTPSPLKGPVRRGGEGWGEGGSGASASSPATPEGGVSSPSIRSLTRRGSDTGEGRGEGDETEQISNNVAAARANMLLGAHLAGAAIEKSMLGAAHACANPLTVRYGIVHGVAVGLLLPHVIRFNAADGTNPYADLCDDAESLARRVESMLAAAGLPPRLKDCGVEASALHALAQNAAEQWTAEFNPRPVGEDELLDIYEAAFQ